MKYVLRSGDLLKNRPQFYLIYLIFIRYRNTFMKKFEIFLAASNKNGYVLNYFSHTKVGLFLYSR